jgi:ribosomal protein S18 acetylase RimI-like enzyme
MIVRPAIPTDAADMTTLLNAIIEIGGSTAHETAYTPDTMLSHYIAPSALICCHVAENDSKVVGFQWLGWPRNPSDPMPDGWGIIASFVAPEAAGMGVGQGLFAATKAAAKLAGVTVIDATIRADNVAGLRYYGGLGFEDYDKLVGVPLQDGTKVDRIRKRFDL